MPDIRVTQPHALSPADAKAKLGDFGEMLAKYGVRLDWTGTEAKIAGVPGVGGHVKITPAQVEVLVSLSRMVTMMGIDAAKLEGSIRKRLAAALG